MNLLPIIQQALLKQDRDHAVALYKARHGIHPELAALLERKPFSPRTKERIKRLNQDWEPGLLPRGYHRAFSAWRYCLMMDAVGYGWLRAKFGRKTANEIWRAMPREEFVPSQGKRKFIRRHAVEDNLHLTTNSALKPSTQITDLQACQGPDNHNSNRRT